MFNMPFRAAIDVSAEIPCAAVGKPVRRAVLGQRLFMALCVVRKVAAKYRVQCAFHFALTQHSAFRLRPPAQQGWSNLKSPP